MKYCMNCGAELTDEAKFCRNCGTPTNNPNKGGDGPTVTARTSDDGEGIVIDAPANSQELPIEQQSTVVDDKESSAPARPNHSAAQKEDDITIIGEEEEEEARMVLKNQFNTTIEAVVEECGQAILDVNAVL